MPYKIIDTHIHVWDLQRVNYPWLKGNTTVLNQNYYLDMLEAERKATGIAEGVLVQAENNLDDTELMLEEAASHSWIKGVVIWLPLTNPAETERLLSEKYRHNPYVKGIRHLIHDEADSRWLLQPAVLESLSLLASYNLTYDVIGVLPAHIETALQVADKIPALKMVFDHLNHPPIATKQMGRWGQLMKEAAGHKNFYAKISGLGTATDNLNNWQPADLEPYLSHIIEQFGSHRCFCGGDWPVSLLAGSYTHTWAAYKTLVPQIAGEEAAQQIFYNNAVAFYNL